MHRLQKRYKRRLRDEDERIIYGQPNLLYNDIPPTFTGQTYIGFEQAGNPEQEKGPLLLHPNSGNLQATQIKRDSSLEKLIRREGVYATEGRESVSYACTAI